MKKVQVLMSTYNGQKYLEEQINSILNQENVEISLLVRDDESSDDTIKVLQELSQKNKNISYFTGKNMGPARSFMELVNKSSSADYYAFSDQDDVWDSKKIISAIEKLEKIEKPCLYISALEIVDENLNTIEIKKVKGNFTFEGEMIKNFANGCTQVFNKQLCDIVKMYNPQYLIMHDSWITRICYAIGGDVIVDDNAYIKYRQHANNVVGYKDEGLQKLKRQFKIAFKENISMRANIANELNTGYGNMLTPNALKVVSHLIDYRKDIKSKMWLINNKNFRTNSVWINFKMILAILLNKF